MKFTDEDIKYIFNEGQHSVLARLKKQQMSEAITGDNAKPHDFIPSDEEDIEANAADTEMRSDDDDRDQAIHEAEQFLDELKSKYEDFIVDDIADFKAQSSMHDMALDIVLDYRTDGGYADEGGFDGFGFASFVYYAMMSRGRTTDRG